MQECQCQAEEMSALVLPTETYALCHHSDPQTIMQAKRRYEELLSRLAAGLDTYMMTETSLAEASGYYARLRLTPQQRNMMNEYERNIVHSAFLRTRATMTTYMMIEKLHQTSLARHRFEQEMAEEIARDKSEAAP